MNAIFPTVSAEVLRFFRAAIVLKVGLYAIIPQGRWQWEWAVPIACMIALAWLAAHPRHYRWAIMAAGTIAWWNVIDSFPYTFNHHVLEAWVLTLLMVFSDERPLSILLMLTVLSLWFYAGLQKLVHGYYVHGEILALEVLCNDDRFAQIFREIWNHYMASSGETVSLIPQSTLLSPHATPVFFPKYFAKFCQAACMTVAVAEMLLPLGIIWRPTRMVAATVLIAFQVCIMAGTVEVSFFFTSILLLLLFVPTRWALLGTGLTILGLVGKLCGVIIK